MRVLGNLLVVLALLLGLAGAAILYQWDTGARASQTVETSPSTPSAAAPATVAKNAASGASPTAAATKAGGGNPQAGKEAYDKFCNACHPAGKAGVGPAVVGLGEEAITRSIRQGQGGMPAFKESQISDQQLGDLLAYVKTLK